MYWALGLGNQIIQVDPGTEHGGRAPRDRRADPDSADVRARRGERGRHTRGDPEVGVASDSGGVALGS